MVETRILPYSAETIAEAARLITAGEPVAVATETVYGLAADATNPHAVARIYAAKGRPGFNPLIVHVPTLADAEELVTLSPELRELAVRYWPGPLTLVAPLRQPSRIASLVAAGLPTLAVRVPAHPAMRALLAATGRPLAAPSANASGTISPTRAEHVFISLNGRIPLIVDAGPCPGGLESTIVAEHEGDLRVLRPGPVQVAAELAPTGKIQSPGQLPSHYAPSKPLRLNASEGRPDEFLIGFGAVAGHSNLSASSNLEEAAARLFDLLHVADAADQPRIAVAPIPDEGLGTAINDRLRRAAAPRTLRRSPPRS
ncbi:threonylcarbamoyl-AMP synthase [Sphingomonas sinipercae]|uniref:Threonylcarbamoyl-AMP synthase n=1 Tax=Sphingomonas sinipercae TaxID=2714944 RepID=A0A6G7ZN75_9SPHN|nr:L-threonylcarbamoyladenylate synthase [Sphingomonas sinipercae]QIL02447.1 threonylcarbamoyl-AMP synthase [Sphingomonas sinipercae]